MPRSTQLVFETLEPRHMLAADLTVVDVQFVDPAVPRQPMATRTAPERSEPTTS